MRRPALGAARARLMHAGAVMKNMVHSRTLTALDWVAVILVAIGAINWGLVGLFQFNLVAAIFGVDSALSRIIYVLVAAAGVYLIVVAATRWSGPRMGGRPDTPVGTAGL